METRAKYIIADLRVQYEYYHMVVSPSKDFFVGGGEFYSFSSTKLNLKKQEYKNNIIMTTTGMGANILFPPPPPPGSSAGASVCVYVATPYTWMLYMQAPLSRSHIHRIPSMLADPAALCNQTNSAHG